MLYGYEYFIRVGLFFVRNNGGFFCLKCIRCFFVMLYLIICVVMDDGLIIFFLCNDIYLFGLNFEEKLII